MKLGDKIIINKNVSVRNMRGTIISSIPGQGSGSCLVKVHSHFSIFLALNESEIVRIPGTQDVDILKDSLFIEQGSLGVIINLLPDSCYLCEFTGPFCNIELEGEEITLFDPKKKQFALLNKVRLLEDVPEHNLKKGMEGVIILVFFKPNLEYCVEFFLGEGEENEWEDYNLAPNLLELVSEVPY